MQIIENWYFRCFYPDKDIPPGYASAVLLKLDESDFEDLGLRLQDKPIEGLPNVKDPLSLFEISVFLDYQPEDFFGDDFFDYEILAPPDQLKEHLLNNWVVFATCKGDYDDTICYAKCVRSIERGKEVVSQLQRDWRYQYDRYHTIEMVTAVMGLATIVVWLLILLLLLFRLASWLIRSL